MKRFDKYEKYGAYHWNAYQNNIEYRKHVDTIKKFFSTQKKGSLLDVGCGDGFISHVLGEMGFTVLGIDNDITAIRLAKSKTVMASFEINKIENINEKIDYILISNVIEHVENDKSLLTCASVLAKTGTLVSTITEDAGLPVDPYNVREYTDKSFSKLMTDIFKDVFVFSIDPMIYAWCKGCKTNGKEG